MRYTFACFVLLLLASAIEAQPVRHLIEFSGITYDPDTVYAAVGDTIVWQGDFTSHPLRSEPVASQRFPANAEEIDVSVGAEFQYVIKVPGEHAYYCVLHVPQGMDGTILVADLGVDAGSGPKEVLSTPNPASRYLEVVFSLARPSDIRIHVFDLQGRELVRSNGSFGPGQNSLRLNIASLPAGVYYYRLLSAEGPVVRTFTIAR